MTSLVRQGHQEIISDLPDINAFKSANWNRTDSLFVCALGFEPRCCAVAEALAEKQYRANHTICLRYGTNVDDNRKNREQLTEALEKFSGSIHYLDADKSEFNIRYRNLVTECLEANESKNVTVDVSAMANRFTISTLSILLGFDIDVCVAYSEAHSYRPTREEYDNNKDELRNENVGILERGVLNIYVSEEHAGNHLDSIPDMLILFPTFAKERSHKVISWIDPSLHINPSSRVVWIVGKPHLEKDHWRIDAMRTLNGLAKQAVPQHVVSTFDYRETLSKLYEICEEARIDYRVTISPLGSKMQAVATAIFCYVNRDITIVFSVPEKYAAESYTEGVREKWVIDLGSASELTSKLQSIGQLRVV